MCNNLKNLHSGRANFKLALILTLVLSLNVFAQTFTVDPKDQRNQASFISDAPLEKIVGVVGGMDAIAMINPNDLVQNPSGKVKIPVKDIKTGIDLRDEHLRSEMWLNADKFPHVEFHLTGIKNPSSKTLTDGQKVKATLVGKFTVHGVTKEIEAPAVLTYFKASERTKAKALGNLLVVKADFNIKLSDYRVKIPDMVVGRMNEEVKITASFVASDAGGGMNPCDPCNPCAMKEKGKCNPCAMKDKGKCNPCGMKENPCNPCSPKKK
jgi:polyisoprenoid-binding protein YceI